MTARIGLVVPALTDAGGLRSVAEFLRRTIRRRADLDLKIISIPMSSADPRSTRLLKPLSFLAGVRTSQDVFNGEPVTLVGAHAVEIETQRLKPRAALSAALESCDLIQVVAGAPSWALPVVGLGKPVVLQVATLTAVERQKSATSERRRLQVWHTAMTRCVDRLDELALRSVEAVLVENDWMLRHSKPRAKPGAIVRYAPPGIDISRFSVLPKRTPQTGCILSVGRLNDPRKNITLLLDSYALLCQRNENAPPLILAGAMGPGEDFWRRASALGIADRISYRANLNREKLAALYRGAQTFVLASNEEGFGLVVIEAMASGVPVVSTLCGGPDSIITDGRDGFLVPCGDAPMMAERLHLLADDAALNLAMGKAARQTAEMRFDEEIAGQAFLDTYDRLLEGQQ